ncbi:MAG: pantoate--beta-alanine ligase [Verrucomicrobiae bacterium]|nr:pantoate--beta-alanine ligase [Verrucomicrobiae bacterium]
MQTVTSTTEMQQLALRLRREGRRIGFVPTMGYLHDGHMSLVREARKHADVVVVSIFVNPTQFAPNEDLKKYPCDIDRDMRQCETEKVDYVFVPTEADIYPKHYSTYVVEEQLAGHLEGASRPAHFRGVCTVVAKLFNIVQPDVAVFGQKDAQQALIIQRMVRDLNFPIQVIVAPIARDPDGLAMSSRNVYLSPPERKQALALQRSLDWCKEAFHKGQHEASELRKGMLKIVLYGPQAKVDYIEFADPETLELLPAVKKGTLVLLAVHIGRTRLIDNVVVE